MTTLTDTINLASNSIQDAFAQTIDTAVVLGSGLSELQLHGYEILEQINYSDITGLNAVTAPSHKGVLTIVGRGDHIVALCAGRHHFYEGHSAQEVAIMTYIMRALGAANFIITNAAGALNPDYSPGEIMLISDHINLTGQNPLIGQDESLGMRFPDMSDAYSAHLRSLAHDSASRLGQPLYEGVYIGVTGPSLETSAERRMFGNMGADAVGMSTVLEVIAAKHAGMNVLGLSAITNMAVGDKNQQADSIEEVLGYAAIAGEKIGILLSDLLKQKLR